MSLTTRFFITHSSKDTDFARRLSDDLHSSGLDGFFDMYSIQPGDDFVARINKGLEECDVYVPILSHAALESPWCTEEINAAIALSNQPSRQGRPRIISVLIEDCVEDIPPLLRNRLYIDFTKAHLSALRKLLEKGFGIDPATSIRQASMFSGPRMQTGREVGDDVWWGAYEVLEFSREDEGKTLRVSVESGRKLNIELWRGGYDGKDLKAWMENRVHITRSSRSSNPTLEWRVERGIYTFYFVDHVHLDRRLGSGPDDPMYAYEFDGYPIRDYEILYRIEY